MDPGKSVNDLDNYVKTFGLDPILCLNLLQDWGLVADECVTVEDVVECEVAVRFVKLNSIDLHAG